MGRARQARPAQRAGRALPDDGRAHCRRGGRARRGRTRPIARRSASTRAPSSRRRGRPARPDQRGAHARRGHDRRPGDDLDRGRRRRSSRTPPCTRSPSSAARRPSPPAPRSGPHAVAVDASSAQAARWGRSVTFARELFWRRGEGGHICGDQELADRRAHEGAAPLVHRRRRHRRGHEHRQPANDDRELLQPARTAARAGRRSAGTSGPASTIRSLLRSRLETMLGLRRDRSSRTTSRPARSRLRAAADDQGGWVYERGERDDVATTELALPGLDSATEPIRAGARPLASSGPAEAADGLLRPLAPRAGPARSPSKLGVELGGIS